MIKSCSECRFFQPDQRISTEAHDGTCRYSPPANYSTPLPDDDPRHDPPPPSLEDGETQLLTWFDNTTYTGWPIVLGSDWCGQWEAS